MASVFSEQPLIPMYKSNLSDFSNSSAVPVNECTIPPENFDRFYSTI